MQIFNYDGLVYSDSESLLLSSTEVAYLASHEVAKRMNSTEVNTQHNII
jgi:hypothetical protein